MANETRVFLVVLGLCLLTVNPLTIRAAFALGGGSLIASTMIAWLIGWIVKR
jgi:hypothetical protein